MMALNIYVQDEIIFDEKEKIIVDNKLDFEILKDLSDVFTIVRYKQKGSDLFFYINDGEKIKYEKDVAYLPSNVLVFIGDDPEIHNIVGGTILHDIHKLKSEQLLTKLYKLKYDNANKKLLEAKKDNAEIRALLENTKGTLQELSLFVNSAGISLHKIDLIFEVDSNSKQLILNGGENFFQLLPVSSASISGIRLFFRQNHDYFYAATDLLQIELVAIESQNIIACWEVALHLIEEEILLELLTPYTGAKESIAIIIRNISQTPIHFLASKMVREKKYLPIDAFSNKTLLQTPIALEIYKSYHTLNITYSPYIKKSDTLISELHSSFLSKNIFKNLEIYLNFLDKFQNQEELAYFKKDNFRMFTLDLLEVVLPHAIGTGVNGITARYRVVSGKGKIGILLLPVGDDRSLIDLKQLSRYEEEGIFTGWKNTEKEESLLHLFLPSCTKEQHHLYLLSYASEKGEEYVIEWTNFEVFNEQL